MNEKKLLNKVATLFLLVFIFCKKEEKILAENNKKFSIVNYDLNHHEAASFCKSNKFNEEYYILIDLGVHPGKNRFYVYDFKEKKIINQALVTHGSCDVFQENPKMFEEAKFDNRKDSYCSMKGKYKIGERGISKWGVKIKYLLHGLEESNKTAIARDVVFHSWEEVENHEVYPDVSPVSQGCPAVSNDFFKLIDKKLKVSNKPVLMWII